MAPGSQPLEYFIDGHLPGSDEKLFLMKVTFSVSLFSRWSVRGTDLVCAVLKILKKTPSTRENVKVLDSHKP